MTSEIKTISMPFFPNVSVNCYLVRLGDGFVLIDTGRYRKRGAIERELERAGCRPGNLKLIVITHGDFDHTGNAAYFREKYGAKIAMHDDDSGMVERGDMLWNRKRPNILISTMIHLLIRLGKANQFRPDFTVADGYDFSEYGFDAKVLSIPGHSRGSIAILAGGGNLFCGDLLGNLDEPKLWSLIDDRAAANASVEKLKSLEIKTVYPGHGKPFAWEQLIK